METSNNMSEQHAPQPLNAAGMVALTAQRDELLAALKFYMAAFGQHLEFIGCALDAQQIEADSKARAAIAKVKGGAA